MTYILYYVDLNTYRYVLKSYFLIDNQHCNSDYAQFYYVPEFYLDDDAPDGISQVNFQVLYSRKL